MHKFYEKYLKYKQKYISLNNLFGGGNAINYCNKTLQKDVLFDEDYLKKYIDFTMKVRYSDGTIASISSQYHDDSIFGLGHNIGQYLLKYSTNNNLIYELNINIPHPKKKYDIRINYITTKSDRRYFKIKIPSILEQQAEAIYELYYFHNIFLSYLITYFNSIQEKFFFTFDCNKLDELIQLYNLKKELETLQSSIKDYEKQLTALGIAKLRTLALINDPKFEEINKKIDTIKKILN